MQKYVIFVVLFGFVLPFAIAAVFRGELEIDKAVLLTEWFKFAVGVTVIAYISFKLRDLMLKQKNINENETFMNDVMETLDHGAIDIDQKIISISEMEEMLKHIESTHTKAYNRFQKITDDVNSMTFVLAKQSLKRDLDEIQKLIYETKANIQNNERNAAEKRIRKIQNIMSR
jgi:hypothetical protein